MSVLKRDMQKIQELVRTRALTLLGLSLLRGVELK
jgi:hypothetical protein